MSKSILRILLVAFCILNAIEARAQSVEALVEEVLQKNPDLKSYEAELAAAQGARYSAGLWQNPEVNGAIGQKRVWNEEDELTGKGHANEIGLSQTFEWPGRLGLRRAIADRDVELAKLGLDRFRVFLSSRVKIAVYKAYAAADSAAAAREVAGHFSSLQEVLAKRSPAGLTPLLESRIIEATDLKMQRASSQALLSSKTALFELNQLRGAAVDDKPVSGEIEIELQPLKMPLDQIVALARSKDYMVREKEIELSRERSALGLAENERLPSITLGPSLSQEKAGDKERVVAVAASLPLPIWNQNQGEIGQAKARRMQAETAHLIAQRDAERSVRETVLIYESKLAEIAKTRGDSIQHFKEAAELSDRHYRLGAVPVTTYVELQTEYVEAIEGLHATKLEALEAALKLEALTGEKLIVMKAKEEAVK